MSQNGVFVFVFVLLFNYLAINLANMNYAIIAAGEGSRLKQEGFTSVKPLVRVNGEYLIERLFRIFKDNNADSISIIINEQSEELKEYLNNNHSNTKINLIVKSTPSSLHSFWNIIKETNIEECCLTTVDTIFNENEFRQYISFFQSHKEIDALMATTKYIDDEKPLYVQTDNNNNILGFWDDKTNNDINQVSAGVYCLRKKAIQISDYCVKNGIARMRNYQRSLLEQRLNVEAFCFSKVIDIDHIEDIQKAEHLLNNFSKKILCIKRLAEYSPNSQNKDEKIISQVAERLQLEGIDVITVSESEINHSYPIYPFVISMARSERVVEILQHWQEKGSIVINSAISCLNCYRERQINILTKNNIPIPKTIIVPTNTPIKESIDFTNGRQYWIKRGDFQTTEPIDVIKVNSIDKANEILDNYQSRGIQSALISENIDGDIIKFYGISKTNWFSYTYPTLDKFNNAINTRKERIKIDEKQFITTCQKAALSLDLDIYGGDAAISTEGNFYIIDMNDFPSFSSCRDEAVENIIECTMNLL